MRCLLVLFFLTFQLASAQSPEAVAAYESGQYDSSIAIAGEDKSADNLAFAARSVLARGVTLDARLVAEAELARAQSYAEQALALDPEHEEGRLQLAISTSLNARRNLVKTARRARLGRKAKSLATEVVRDAPDNFYAHGFLAVWHVEVFVHGGGVGAVFMGASMEDAQAHFAHAAELAPRDVALHWQWARALSALNPTKYKAQIATSLQIAKSAAPSDYLAQVFQSRALWFDEVTADMSLRDIRKLAAELL